MAVPAGLESPEPIPSDQNGYARLTELMRGWPSEGHVAPDLKYRLRTLSTERKAAERALAPLRPFLDRIDEALDVPVWQARITPDAVWPELPQARRWGYALLLRNRLDGNSVDRERAIELARRLRRAQGVMLHLIVSVSLEKMAEGDLSGLRDDRLAAIHWDLARMTIPYAHWYGPWDPLLGNPAGEFEDQRRVARWSLAGHPNAYDPAATVDLLLGLRQEMEVGTADELDRRVEETGTPWPRAMWVPGGFGVGLAPISELRRARPLLRQIDNPYGRLAAAWNLHVARGIAKLVEASQAGT